MYLLLARLLVVRIRLDLLVVRKVELHGGRVIAVRGTDDEVDPDLLQDLASVDGGVVPGSIQQPDGVPPPFLVLSAE